MTKQPGLCLTWSESLDRFSVDLARLVSNNFYAPNFEKVGTYWFRLVRMYVCVCVCVCMYVCMYVCKVKLVLGDHYWEGPNVVSQGRWSLRPGNQDINWKYLFFIV